jgi:hypothetical protein
VLCVVFQSCHTVIFCEAGGSGSFRAVNSPGEAPSRAF